MSSGPVSASIVLPWGGRATAGGMPARLAHRLHRAQNQIEAQIDQVDARDGDRCLSRQNDPFVEQAIGQLEQRDLEIGKRARQGGWLCRGSTGTGTDQQPPGLWVRMRRAS